MYVYLFSIDISIAFDRLSVPVKPNRGLGRSLALSPILLSNLTSKVTKQIPAVLSLIFVISV